jgi:hypothetical protein
LFSPINKERRIPYFSDVFEEFGGKGSVNKTRRCQILAFLQKVGRARIVKY